MFYCMSFQRHGWNDGALIDQSIGPIGPFKDESVFARCDLRAIPL